MTASTVHSYEIFRFGSKAETLGRLRPLIKLSSIPRSYTFTVSLWRETRQTVLDEIVRCFHDMKQVIIRSSALSEDGEFFSLAGAFLSVPHVDPRDAEQLARSVDEVISSYAHNCDAKGQRLDHQILVQAMVHDVMISGVLFTQDLTTGAPYYVINYDDETGSTDTITAGIGYANRTLYVYRNSWKQIESARFLRLIEATREIETVTENDCLDIEFVLDSKLNVHLLQVRRITTQPNWNRGIALRIGDTLGRLKEALEPRLLNSKRCTEPATVLGKMPDWNPAEMIGNAPRRLAFSLYRLIITDSTWRRARAKMGYYEPRGRPLMLSLAGQPYIDVRQSFRSFLPDELPEALRERLVDAWIAKLGEKPHLHDKVEFEVALTTLSFDFDERLERLAPGLLADDEQHVLKEAFRRLTIDLVEGHRASIEHQKTLITELEQRRRAAINQSVGRPGLNLVAQLLEDAIEYGTIAFSILARHAFIATTLLRSLVTKGILDESDVERFQQNVPTVAREFIDDIDRFAKGELSEDTLMQRYGHLRPGTYDILSLRYDQRGLGHILCSNTDYRRDVPSPFYLSTDQEKAIAALLRHEEFSISPEALFAYFRDAIQSRESAKLAFSRGVSDVLEIVAFWGQQLGLSRAELSCLDIREILDCQVESKGRSLEQRMRSLAEAGSADHMLTAGIRLPYLITRPSDFVVVPINVEQPNFVTLKSVQGPSVLITGRDHDPEVLDNKIVMIENADPGFDWIFTRPIRGLITKFGGANSHMAIRCAEFDLPAAIGCGEQIFERILNSGFVEMDCAVGRIELSRH